MNHLAVGATFTALVSCTTFYGVDPSDGTTSTGGASNGGEGGGIAAQDGLLSRFDAAHTCSLLLDCPSVARDLVDAIGVATLPNDQITRASYSACVDWLSQPLRRAHAGFDLAQPIVACLAVVSTCDAARFCLVTERLGSSDPRCVSPLVSRCEGADWIDCEGARVAHCEAAPFGAGASCYTSGGEVACGIGVAAAPETSCSGSTFFTATAAGTPRRAFDCAALGLSCDADAPDPACAGASGVAICDAGEVDVVSCSADGRRAQVCTARGFRAEVDCAAEGDTCATTTTTAVRCEVPDATCDPFAADVDVCEGSQLRMCLRGKITPFDCASIGARCLGPSGDLSGRCGIP
jgi:hypothetical protein